MTRILENTATTTIYQIEGQFPEASSPQYRGTWCQREMTPAVFGETHPKHGDDWLAVAPFFTAYGACGDCWQRTGQNGYLSKPMALKAFGALLQHAPPDKHVTRWRLVERIIAVRVNIVAEGTAAK